MRGISTLMATSTAWLRVQDPAGGEPGMTELRKRLLGPALPTDLVEPSKFSRTWRIARLEPVGPDTLSDHVAWLAEAAAGLQPVGPGGQASAGGSRLSLGLAVAGIGPYDTEGFVASGGSLAKLAASGLPLLLAFHRTAARARVAAASRPTTERPIGPKGVVHARLSVLGPLESPGRPREPFLHPADVTRAIGLTPTRSGYPEATQGRTAGYRSLGRWELDSNDAVDSQLFSEHLEWVLKMVGPAAQRVRDYCREHDVRAHVYGYVGDDGTIRLVLSPDSLSRLAALGLDFDLRVKV